MNVDLIVVGWSGGRKCTSDASLHTMVAGPLARHDVIYIGEMICLDIGGTTHASVEIWPIARTTELVEQTCAALLADALPGVIVAPEDQQQ